MTKTISTRKGLDIKLIGQADKIITNLEADEFAVKPTDFNGVFPKLLINEGDHVKAGTPLFYDKYNESVMFSSPVSGTIKAIKRGAKRVLEEIIITSDGKMEYEDFTNLISKAQTPELVEEALKKTGLWNVIRQRPFSTIAQPGTKPKAVHISAFDSAPLAADYDFLVHGYKDEFSKGIEIIKLLSGAKMHLNIHADKTKAEEFLSANNVQMNRFKGPHPVGNVGVQIHHIDPINKGDVVWYIKPQDVIDIGRLFIEGKYNTERLVALCGSEVKKPKYFKTFKGATVSGMIKENLKEGEVRIISGNVLTGTKINNNGFVGAYDTMICVIPEGNYYEFFGWAKPGLKTFSFSGAFPSKLLFPGMKYRLDTNLHGGERAFVLSGQYEKVLPMDILPVQLIKSIMVNDIDQMENLGIYEVDEEDFALCEVICTSKTEVQSIIRAGIDLIRKEMS